MVGRRVRRDDRIEAADSRAAQEPRHARLRASAVEEDGASVRVLDQGRIALPHVQEGDREHVRRSRIARARGHEQAGGRRLRLRAP